MSQNNENSKGHGTPVEDNHEQKNLFSTGEGIVRLADSAKSQVHESILAGLRATRPDEDENHFRHSDFRAGYVSKVTATVLGHEDLKSLSDIYEWQGPEERTGWTNYETKRSANETVDSFRMPYTYTGSEATEDKRTWVPPTFDGDTGDVQPANPVSLNVPACRSVEFEVHFEDMGYIFEHARRYDSSLFEWIIEPIGVSDTSIVAKPLPTSVGLNKNSHAFTARFHFPYVDNDIAWSVKLKINDPYNNHDNFFGFGSTNTWKIADCISKKMKSPDVSFQIGEGKKVICTVSDEISVIINSTISGLDECNVGDDDITIKREYSSNVLERGWEVEKAVQTHYEIDTGGVTDSKTYADEVLSISIPAEIDPENIPIYTFLYNVEISGKIFGVDWSYKVPVSNMHITGFDDIPTNEVDIGFSRPRGNSSSIIWSEQGITKLYRPPRKRSFWDKLTGRNESQMFFDDVWVREERFNVESDINIINTSLPGYIVNAEEDDHITIQVAGEDLGPTTSVSVEVQPHEVAWIPESPPDFNVGTLSDVRGGSLNGKQLLFKQIVVSETSALRTLRHSNVIYKGEALRNGCTIVNDSIDVVFVTPKHDILEQIDNLKPSVFTEWSGNDTSIHLSWTPLNSVKYLEYEFTISYKVKVVKWENNTATEIDTIKVDPGEDSLTISGDGNIDTYNMLERGVEYYFHVCPVFDGKDLWHASFEKHTACLDDEHWSVCDIDQTKTSSIVLSECSGCSGITLTDTSNNRTWACGLPMYFGTSTSGSDIVDNQYWSRGGVLSRHSYVYDGGFNYTPFKDQISIADGTQHPADEELEEILEMQIEVTGKLNIFFNAAERADYSRIHSSKEKTVIKTTNTTKLSSGDYLIQYGQTAIRIDSNEATAAGSFEITYKPASLIWNHIVGFRVIKTQGRGDVTISGLDWDKDNDTYKSLHVIIDDTYGIDDDPSTEREYPGNSDIYKFTVSAITLPKNQLRYMG